MDSFTTLETLYPGRILMPSATADIPKDGYMAYILERDAKAVVVGHGERKRAKVILDSLETSTAGHLKAIFVRLYQLFSPATTVFSRYLVVCANKKEARDVEKKLHASIGGNHRELPPDIIEKLFADIPERSMPWMLLKMALASSYDGLSDLSNWSKHGLIDPEYWKVISDRLMLESIAPKKKKRNSPK